MISVDKLAVHIGARTLFENVSFFIRPHDRIALTGANGSGKTTLLKVIAGRQEADGGSISLASFVSVGYLQQEGMTVSGRSLTDEAASAFDDVIALQARLDTALADVSSLPPDSPEHAELIEVIGELHHRLEDLDAYAMRSRVEKVLMGLGFTPKDLERQTEEFSGGWQMRIALAKLLLRTPSVLLLDEPTNHLDIESQAWLVDYLTSYDGAVLVVSHDTVFLDEVTTRTLALEQGSIEDFPGTFSAFIEYSLTRKEQTAREFQNQQARIRETERFIERFRYKATKARQVQSRIKQLERMDKIELEAESEEIDFRFPDPPSAGKILMTLDGIVKEYGTKQVLNNVSVAIANGDRIAVVGVNGAGKSTLVRIIAGVESPTLGSRTPGHNLTVSYFAQHQADELDPSVDVLTSAIEVSPAGIRPKVRSMLGSFLFHGDDVFKSVRILSGGEKSRLALARMLLRPANLLILDEPTNHLDLRSKAVLQEALLAYEGSFVVVSHDRGFLDPLVNKVLEVSPSGIRIFHSTVTEYLERRQAELRASATSSASATVGRSGNAKERKRREAALRQEKSRRAQPLKDRLTKLEKDIDLREADVREIETTLADPGFFERGGDAKELSARLKSSRRELEVLLATWESVGQDLEALETEYRQKLQEFDEDA